MVGNSLSVATWTIVSRVTGVGKVVTVAAVLGPTYLGNTYQAANTLPNLVYYGLLAGSLFGSLLVPPLVRHRELHEREATERLARGFLGAAITAFALMTAAVVVSGPLVVRALSLGVQESTVAAAQRRVGLPLLVMLMPQVVLYGVAGTGAAVLNAHGRFSLAAAAPALENIGIMTTMAASAAMFGTGTSLEHIAPSHLLLLGLGTTAAVGLHAGAQWWGAWRVGILLVPRAGWRDPEVRQLLRRAVPLVAHASLSALQGFVVLIVANRVPGGVVAFQLALNFFSLPGAVGANAVAVALLPQLARLDQRGDRQLFRDEFVRGLSWAFFLTVPAAVAYVVLAGPLARAVAFGEMANPTGVTLIAASLAAIGLGVVGETGFLVGAQASYAQQDVRTPFISMVVRTGVHLVGMFIALFLHGTAVLVALGLSISVGDLVGASHLGARLKSTLPKAGRSLAPSLLRTLIASALMVAPAYLVAVSVASWVGGRWSHLMGMLVAVAVGIATFGGLQRIWNSAELEALLAELGKFRSEHRDRRH